MTDTRAVPAPFTSIMQQNHPNLRRLSLGQNRCFENTIDTLHKWLSPNEGDLVSLDLNQLSLYKEQLLGYIAAGYLQSIETLSLRQCPVNDDTGELPTCNLLNKATSTPSSYKHHLYPV